MKVLLLFAAVSALAALVAAAPAPLLYADSAAAVKDRYIVVFKDGLASSAAASHIRRVRGLSGRKIDADNQFQIGSLSGYFIETSSVVLSAIRNLPEVSYVEADQKFTISSSGQCVSQSDVPSWGLTRVSEVNLDLSEPYNYPNEGEGVTNYVIDTGVLITHVDFGGRAVWGANFADTENTDCNGHGTHVAGTVGGTTYGIAKKTTIVAVKVLDCDGSGTTTGVIKGVEYAVKDSEAKKNKGVANMSLGGPYSATLNAAVRKAVDGGVTFVVAAGNNNADACSYSPASETTSISVGATYYSGTKDVRSSFSNYGSCVSVFAPGTSITSAWIGSNTAEKTISGTSMASPHVAGLASLIATANPSFTPAQVKNAILTTANKDKIDLLCSNTKCQDSPNLLAFNSC